MCCKQNGYSNHVKNGEKLNDNQIERQEKIQEEAELQFTIQRDIEQERKSKREREIAWVLHGRKCPSD
jgi:uncharacterized protein YjaG (DUF416 family)